MIKEKEVSKEKMNMQKNNQLLALSGEKGEIAGASLKESAEKKVSYFQLQYKFADKVDCVLIIIATLGSLIAGASMPLISLLLGSAINNFGPDVNKADLSEKITTLAINYILCGIGILLGSFMMSFFWSLVSKRLINKINLQYFQVLLRQEQGYFDQGQKNEHFVTKINQEIKIIENGIGLKVGQALMSISQFIASFIVGYITSWQLSLVLTAMLPLLGIGGWFMAKAMDQGQASNEAYVNAGAMSQEILKEIKTVASFANFDHEKDKYRGYIESAMRAGIKQGFKAGFGIGFIVFIVYNSYALAVGYGSYLISNKSTNKNSGEAFGAGDVITVLFSIIFGCFSLGQATPYINAILSACNAAKGVFTLLARKPKIDLSTSKLKPDKACISGKITFKDVCFAYPSKPDELILDNLNLVIEPGQKVAIVGESGSGKSTVLSLIERLYDPQSGSIQFDDFDIKNLDLEYLRSLIGYVPQMPVLLNTSIKENIIFGRAGVSDEDIDIAVKNAYAKDFVDQKGLEYNVGAGGKMLSGGQKQRIAIARAIVNKPKILIFDEATSALDNKAEKEVQSTLDMVCKGLSSITVAHRITTIKNADKIICLDGGKVVEQGTHKELLGKNGFYAHLINQYVEEEEDEEFDEECSAYDDLKCKNEKAFGDFNGNNKENDGEIVEYDEEKIENCANNNNNDYNNNLSNNVNAALNEKGKYNTKTLNKDLKSNLDVENEISKFNSVDKSKNFNFNNNNNNANFNFNNANNYGNSVNNPKGVLKNNNYNNLNGNSKTNHYNTALNNNFNRMDYEEDKIEQRFNTMRNQKSNINCEGNQQAGEFGFNQQPGSSTNLKDSYYLNQSGSKDEVLNENHLSLDEGNINKLHSTELVNNLNISGNFDEKNHKAEEDCFSANNSLNESGIEIGGRNRKCLNLNNLNASESSKNESLLGNNKEKMQSVRSNRNPLRNLMPDIALENFNSQKDGYLQINDDKVTPVDSKIIEDNKNLKNMNLANSLSTKNFNLSNNQNNDVNNFNNNNANPNNFPSGNLSHLSRGSKKVLINEQKYSNPYNQSGKNLELGYRKSQENLSFKRDSDRKSLNSRNRKSLSEKKSNNEALVLAEKIRLEKENKKEEEVNYSEEKFKRSRRRLFAILKDHKRFLVGAGCAAAFNGAVWPIYGILLADAIGTLSDKDVGEVRAGGMLVAIYFVCLALVAALVLWMQNYFFYGIGEILNKEFRVRIFAKFLNLHVGYFENKLNNPMSVLARLSSYTSKIGGVATNIVGQMIQTSVTLILGITLALVYDWRLCLINLCFMPLVIGTYVIQFKVSKSASAQNLELESEAASVLGETLSNTKTVYAYNMQTYIVSFYARILRKLNFTGIYKSNIVNGILYAISQFIVFGMYATLFYAGGKFFEDGTVSLKNMMRAILTILFSALGVGIAQAFVGDYSAAQKGIVGLYDFLDEKSLIDVEESCVKGFSIDEGKNVNKAFENSDKDKDKDINNSNARCKNGDFDHDKKRDYKTNNCLVELENRNSNSNKINENNEIGNPNNDRKTGFINEMKSSINSNHEGNAERRFQGKIEFRDVKFFYPNNERNLVFNNLNFTIEPGKSAAFVGPSGSGKSTIISLIERFYDVNSGKILIDDRDIRDYDLIYLRKKIGTVLQEPGIFSRPIRDNIRYGNLEATDEQIENAAKKAFIENSLGNANALGSGGEMQRVAIARAILKNPSILLLDEATSALDANLEEHIKNSLKELMKNRTSIAVAHRLTTIINCDIIFYLENGTIVEKGSHEELLKLNGRYASLYNQSIN